MKRIISIILGVIIMLSALAFSVSAESEENIFVGDSVNCISTYNLKPLAFASGFKCLYNQKS